MTRPSDTAAGSRSADERATVDAIVFASGYASNTVERLINHHREPPAQSCLLRRGTRVCAHTFVLSREPIMLPVYCRFAMSIVMIGVGDGPWEQMEEFDDR